MESLSAIIDEVFYDSTEIHAALDEIMYTVWFIDPIIRNFIKWRRRNRGIRIPKRLRRWRGFLVQFCTLNYTVTDQQYNSMLQYVDSNQMLQRYRVRFIEMIENSCPIGNKVNVCIDTSPTEIIDVMIQRKILSSVNNGTRIWLNDLKID